LSDIRNPTTNVSLYGGDNESDLSKAVTVTTVGAKTYLDIAATIVNNESPTRYQLKTDYDATGDLLTSAADVVLYSFTGNGVIDYVGVSNATTSNYLIAIEIDGTERIRINMSDLGSVLGMTSGSTPFWTETANKLFRYNPTSEVGFATSFRILARATGANTTVTHFVAYRERI